MSYFKPDKKETAGVKTIISKRHRTKLHTAERDHKNVSIFRSGIKPRTKIICFPVSHQLFSSFAQLPSSYFLMCNPEHLKTSFSCSCYCSVHSEKVQIILACTFFQIWLRGPVLCFQSLCIKTTN